MAFRPMCDWQILRPHLSERQKAQRIKDKKDMESQGYVFEIKTNVHWHDQYWCSIKNEELDSLECLGIYRQPIRAITCAKRHFEKQQERIG